MARHVIHGIVGCLATSVAKVPERWKHSIKQHKCYNEYITIFELGFIFLFQVMRLVALLIGWPTYISARCMTLLKIIQIEPCLNLICVFLWLIIGICLSPRGITLLKIIWPDPHSNSTCVFSWHIYIPNFNSKCQKDNERKLKINWIFLSPGGTTLPKIIWPDQNLNSTCIFLWQSYVPNFIWISPCMTEIMSGNWIRNDGRTKWRKGV